jgi:hypothetical protein
MDRIRIFLERATDDPHEADPEFQKELSEFYRALQRERVPFSLGPFGSVRELSYWVPNFWVTLVPAAIAGAAGVCGAWVQARYGRKVRLEITTAGDVKAEGRSVEEIEALLQKAKEFKESQP